MTGETLMGLGRQVRANSERWFPELHARGDQAIWVHEALGLAGEAGEVANLVKKMDSGKRSMESIEGELAEELADVFTYLLLLADHLGINLEAELAFKQRICENRWGRR